MRRIVSAMLALCLASAGGLSNAGLAYAAASAASATTATAVAETPTVPASEPTTVAEGPAVTTTVAAESAARGPATSASTVVRELVEKRTASSREYLLRNGNTSVEYHAGPIHYRDPSSGRFEPIDATLVTATVEGREVVRNRANAFTLTLPKRLDDDAVRLESDGVSVEIRPARRSRPGEAAVANDAVAWKAEGRARGHYDDAFDAADLTYESLPEGLKETIVLDRAPAATSWPFEMTLSGVTPRVEKHGSISLLRDRTDSVAYVIPAPFMIDSSGAPDGEDYSDNVRYELSGTSPTYRLVVVADSGWLSDPARVYPVRVDPSLVTTSDYPSDTFVSEGNKDTNYLSHPSIWADASTGHHEYGLYEPDQTLTNDMEAKRASGHAVVAGELKVRAYDVVRPGDVRAIMCTTSTATYLSGVTWNTKPSTTSTLGTGYQPIIDAGSYYFDVTKMTRYWQTLRLPYYKMCLQLYPEDVDDAHIAFYSRERSTTSMRPRWTIEYSSVPSATLLAPISGVVTSAPSAVWSYSDEHTHTQAAYEVQVATNTASPYTTISGMGEATSCALTEPAWGWVPGQTYSVRVRAASAPTLETQRLWSAWSAWGSFTWGGAAGLTEASATIAPGGWWRSADTDGDGAGDTLNDSGSLGRGDVTLSWAAVAGADRYNVWMHDGRTFRYVGKAAGSQALDWSTKGMGIYPSDSAVAALPGGYTGDPYARGSSPKAATKMQRIGLDYGELGEGVPPEGAGVVVSDGRYLYVRAWGDHGGPASWQKFGSGLNGTERGMFYGFVGPDLTDKPLESAFYLDGFLYGAHAETANSISGLWAKQPEVWDAGQTVAYDQDNLRQLRFREQDGDSKPLLGRTTGAELTGPSSDVLITTDGERIYNVAQSCGNGYDGWRIRVYDRDGVWVRDAEVPGPSYLTDGVMADGQSLYLVEWTGNDSARISKVGLSDYEIGAQWAIDQGATRVVNGCYDAANKCFWMGSLDTSSVYRYEGPGLGLRDDPNPLYSKMSGGLDRLDYSFKIQPANAAAGAALSSCPTVSVTLPSRTAGTGQEVQHTTIDLGEMAKHGCEAVVDSATADPQRLQLSATDLVIESLGPEAALARVYRSDDTSSTSFAAGWRFNFQRGLEIAQDASIVTYVDAACDRHAFPLVGDAYRAPVGAYSTLTTESAGLFGGVTYHLRDKDGTEDTFDGEGVLLRTTDRNGNEVAYERPWLGPLTIRAANGQTIVVSLDGNGVPTHAEYSTSDGVRAVDYSSGEVPAVTYYPGTEDEYSVTYRYVGSLLATVAVPDFHGSVPAEWGMSYDASRRVTQVRYPGQATDAARRTDISYLVGASGAGTATVTRWGAVQAASGIGSTVATVTETYGYNPSGTMAAKSNARTASELATASTYAYDPHNNPALERSPRGNTTARSYDASGNMLTSTDVHGHTTTYLYNDANDCVREIDPVGCATYRSFDARGNTLVEEKVLDTYGNRSRHEWDYDQDSGRVIAERERVSADETAVTVYEDPAPNGEPQRTVQEGVRLAPAGSPTDLITTSGYSDFGDEEWSKNALGEYERKDCVYSPAGRLLTSADASDTLTRTAYDALGNAIDTSRSAGGDVADWSRTSYLSTGEPGVRKTLADAAGSLVANETTLTYDAMGREIRSADAVEGTTTTLYDARGNALSTWSPGSDTASRTASQRSWFDADGNETHTVEPGAHDSGGALVTYDVAGKETQRVEADGVSTSYFYDENDAVVQQYQSTDGNDQVSDHYFDVAGREIMTEKYEYSDDEFAEYYGTCVTYTIDAAGRSVGSSIKAAQAWDATRQVAATTYNALGWKLSETDADGVASAWAYDHAGRVTTETIGGKTTTHAYDGCGREWRQVTPDGGTITTVYDPFGRATREIHSTAQDALTRDLETQYDVAGRATASLDNITGLRRRYNYTERASAPQDTAVVCGSVTSTATVTNAGVEVASSVGFESTAGPRAAVRTVTAVDAALRPISASWLTTTGTSLVSTRAYDAAGRLSAQGGLGFTGAGATYTYSTASGLKTSEVWRLRLGTTLSQSYSYTNDARLMSYTRDGAVTAYTWSPIGNIATVTVGAAKTHLYYDDGNRLMRMGTTTYGWDKTRGLRTSADGVTQDWAWTYDDAGRLTRAAGTGARSVTATYTYDAAGQRTSSRVTSGTTTTETSYVYEGLTLHALAATSTTGGAVTTWTVNYLYDGSGGLYGAVYAASDAGAGPMLLGCVTTDRGDVVELTDEAGNAFARYDTDAWGAPRATTYVATARIPYATAQRISDRQPLRYANCCYDAPVGLYYLSQRYYDPATMQFLTKDPADADGEQSSYQYCGGDPVGAADPGGCARKLLSVPDVRARLVCWTGAMRAILKEAKHTWFSEDYIFYKVRGHYPRKNESLSRSGDVNKAFDRFGVYYSHPRRSLLSWTAIQSQIKHGWPMLAFVHAGGPDHVLVIRGYNTSGKKVLLMDPAYGTGHARTYQELRNGRFWISWSRYQWFDTAYDIGK